MKLLLFFIIFNVQSLLILSSDKKNCASTVDLCYLQNLKDHIYDELKYGFFNSNKFRINKRFAYSNKYFADYITKLRSTNNPKGKIKLSTEQEVSIFAFIESMHLKNEHYFLKYEDIEALLKAACKDCAISINSADTIMSHLSSAYLRLF